MSSICLTIFNQFLANKTFKLYPRIRKIFSSLLSPKAFGDICQEVHTGRLYDHHVEQLVGSTGLVEAKKRISARFSCQRFDEIFQRRLKERKNSQQQNGGGGGNNDDYREGSAMEQIVDALIEMGCTGEEKDDDDGVPP
ncbi:unnamed protein product [Cylindrotheca closterium]|uniref:Uncharacterized protein n=1 Tax=Cylindrotheca closterium TaxID=2856 RepID=A0AAD2G9C7_9STRA|nr:unnamed protein product [Cylindrotheca closterium]